MATNLALANALAPLLTVVTRFFKMLGDATLQYESEAWATATTLYSMLKKASRRQPALKAELAPLETFFAYRPPSTATKGAASPDTKKAKRDATIVKNAEAESATVISDAPVTPATTAPASAGAAPPAASPPAAGGTTHA